jgi:PIN domain nuclease of toxin-antitoxin system
VRLLLDTHALLWWLDGDRRLPSRVRAVVGGSANEILVSAASVWEITTKARLGKLPRATDVAADVPACIQTQGFVALPITAHHAQRAGTLPGLFAIPSIECWSSRLKRRAYPSPATRRSSTSTAWRACGDRACTAYREIGPGAITSAFTRGVPHGRPGPAHHQPAGPGRRGAQGLRGLDPRLRTVALGAPRIPPSRVLFLPARALAPR